MSPTPEFPFPPGILFRTTGRIVVWNGVQRPLSRYFVVEDDELILYLCERNDGYIFATPKGIGRIAVIWKWAEMMETVAT